MEWEEVNPDQNDWQRQWNLTAYCGELNVGSIVLDVDGAFRSVVNGQVEFMESSNLDEAKKEFCETLDSFFESKIDYYNDMREMLTEIG